MPLANVLTAKDMCMRENDITLAIPKLLYRYLMGYMGGSRKFCQRGSNFDKFFFFFFLVDEGRETKYHYKRAIIGPPAKRH